MKNMRTYYLYQLLVFSLLMVMIKYFENNNNVLYIVLPFLMLLLPQIGYNLFYVHLTLDELKN